MVNAVGMSSQTAEILASLMPDMQRIVPADGHVVLFGSRARGDERADSDFDLLVLLDRKGRATWNDHDNIVFPLNMEFWGRGLTVNTIMQTNEEWQAKKATPLYENILNEGVKVL